MNDKPKSDAAAWERLGRFAEELPEGAPAEEVARRIREGGGDPEAIAARGRALAAELLEKRDRLAWRGEARAQLDAARTMAASLPSRRGLSRADLLGRIEALRGDPRAPARVVVAYRKRSPGEATDDELAALLEEMELAAALDRSGGNDGGGSSA